MDVKDLYIDLNEYTTKKQRVFRLLIYETLICIGLMLLTVFLFFSFSSTIEYYLLVIPIYLLLYLYFVWISLKTNLFIKVNEDSIVLKFGIRNSSKDILLWDTIKNVRVGPTYISFYKKSGKRRRFMLGWLPYAQVIEIKDKLIDVFESKKIPYEVVDFIRYQTRPIRNNSLLLVLVWFCS